MLCLWFSAQTVLLSEHMVQESFLKPTTSRFQLTAPFPALPWIKMDQLNNGIGVAQLLTRSKNLQARILWIDGTANLDRVNSPEKIAMLVAKAKQVGFNTLVFDVKPIVGYTLYPSKLTPKLEFWRGQKLPLDFDPLAAMCKETQKKGLDLFVSLNAFSEGHRLAYESKGPGSPYMGPGPGYEKPAEQTVQYDAQPILMAPSLEEQGIPLALATSSKQIQKDLVSVFPETSSLRPLLNKIQLVLVDSSGLVVFHLGDPLKEIPSVPRGGSALVGLKGTPGGDFLAKYGHVGLKFKFASKPLLRPISENQTQIPLMMNPHHPAVQNRVLRFLEEIVGQYPIQGVLFDDRLRFGGLNSDFSDETRRQFEAWVGSKVRWPEDVFEFSFTPALTRGLRPGRWYESWLAWRAFIMRQWVSRARLQVDRARPGTLFGIYAGSWYGEYPKWGSNYASSKLDAGFYFLDKTYLHTGFADLLDVIVLGCYYNTATLYEALEKGLPLGQTVEAGGMLGNRVVRDQAWTYAGIMLQTYYNNPRALENALQAAAGSTQGVMVFDLSHRIEEVWPIFERAFREPARAPHSQKKLLKQVRATRKNLDKLGHREPPIPILEGGSGVGH